MNIKSAFILLLIFSILFSSCATGRRFTPVQIEQDKEIFKRLINKRVEVYTRNDKKIGGYFQAFDEKSIILLRPNRDKISRLIIAKEKIVSIKLKKEDNPAYVVGFLAVLLLLYLSAKGLTKGLSNI